jgi:AraC-like DNA-binding protein
MFIADLCRYLREEEGLLHFIKGALLCVCHRGRARIKINYTTHTLHAHDLLVILPTHLFSIEATEEDTLIEALLYSEEYWASISHSVDYKLLKAVEFHPLLSLPKEAREETRHLLRLIRQHEAENNIAVHIRHALVGGLAFSLLMLLVSKIDPTKADVPHLVTRKEILTHDFFELLAQHYERERQVAFYASQLCITPKHLSAMVKEVTHLPIQEWINNVTLLHIKRRLLTTTDTIQKISEDLHFQTASTFVRYFRQHVHITPSKYRNQHLRH